MKRAKRVATGAQPVVHQAVQGGRRLVGDDGKVCQHGRLHPACGKAAGLPRDPAEANGAHGLACHVGTGGAAAVQGHIQFAFFDFFRQHLTDIDREFDAQVGVSGLQPGECLCHADGGRRLVGAQAQHALSLIHI